MVVKVVKRLNYKSIFLTRSLGIADTAITETARKKKQRIIMAIYFKILMFMLSSCIEQLYVSWHGLSLDWAYNNVDFINTCIA